MTEVPPDSKSGLLGLRSGKYTAKVANVFLASNLRRKIQNSDQNPLKLLLDGGDLKSGGTVVFVCPMAFRGWQYYVDILGSRSRICQKGVVFQL